MRREGLKGAELRVTRGFVVGVYVHVSVVTMGRPLEGYEQLGVLEELAG